MGWKIFLPEVKINITLKKNKIKQEAVLPKAQKIDRCCKIKNKPKDKKQRLQGRKLYLKRTYCF